MDGSCRSSEHRYTPDGTCPAVCLDLPWLTYHIKNLFIFLLSLFSSLFLALSSSLLLLRSFSSCLARRHSSRHNQAPSPLALFLLPPGGLFIPLASAIERRKDILDLRCYASSGVLFFLESTLERLHSQASEEEPFVILPSCFSYPPFSYCF